MQLVLLGGGHGHLATIHAIPALQRLGYTVTVVDPSEELFYSGSIASVVGAKAARNSGIIPIRRLTQERDGTFIQSAAQRIDVARRQLVLSNGSTVPWDLLSCSVGGKTIIPFSVQDAKDGALCTVIPVKPFSMAAIRQIDALDGPLRIAVVGGGASGVEFAGNLHRRGRLYNGKKRVFVELFAAGGRLLPRQPRKAGTAAAASMRGAGINIHFNTEVSSVNGGSIYSADGSQHGPYDAIFLATGVGVSEIFKKSNLPVDDNGTLVVAPTLKVPGLPIFAVGDCAAVGCFHLEKIGVHAVRQGAVLLENLRRWTQDRELQPYKPPMHYLQIINVGDDSGIAIRGQRVCHGRLWLGLKERIDWGFVRSGGRSTFPAFSGPPAGRDFLFDDLSGTS